MKTVKTIAIRLTMCIIMLAACLYATGKEIARTLLGKYDYVFDHLVIDVRTES